MINPHFERLYVWFIFKFEEYSVLLYGASVTRRLNILKLMQILYIFRKFGYTLAIQHSETRSIIPLGYTFWHDRVIYILKYGVLDPQTFASSYRLWNKQINLSLSPSFYLSIIQSLSISVCWTITLTIYPPFNLSICLSVCYIIGSYTQDHFCTLIYGIRENNHIYENFLNNWRKNYANSSHYSSPLALVKRGLNVIGTAL